MFEQEIQKLSNELSVSLPAVLKTASSILGRQVSAASLNGIFGGKNRTHAEIENRSFSCFEEFFACWLEAMYQDYLKRRDEPLPMEKAGYRNAKLLQNAEIMAHVEKFLKRTFLRWYENLAKKSRESEVNHKKFQNEIVALKEKFHSI